MVPRQKFKTHEYKMSMTIKTNTLIVIHERASQRHVLLPLHEQHPQWQHQLVHLAWVHGLIIPPHFPGHCIQDLTLVSLLCGVSGATPVGAHPKAAVAGE